MEDTERFQLLGKYRTPRFRIGQRVFCEVWGAMVITDMTDALIPWPIGKGGAGRHSLIVYKGLAKAVRRWLAVVSRTKSPQSSFGLPLRHLLL